MFRSRVALLAALLLVASGCAPAPQPPSAPSGCSYRVSGTSARPVDPPDPATVRTSGTSRVTLDFGDASVDIDLDHAAAPCTTHSFLSLVSQGFYTGTTCHRLATRGLFVLHCGDPSGTGVGGPGYTFDDELKGTSGYPAGAVAMATAGPNSNGSQFFLVYQDSPLPPTYTVFGTMTPASTQAVADKAFQGHDSSWPDGTGRPNAPATIRAVVSG